MYELSTYIQHLELLAFFSGYPVLYLALQLMNDSRLFKSFKFVNRAIALLPFAYAFTGTLFIGLVLKNMYPGYAVKDFVVQFHEKFLRIWALFSLLFWMPFFSRKIFFSLIHSFIFFSILLRDILLSAGHSSSGAEELRNDMRMYVFSIMLNIFSLLFIYAFSFVKKFLFKNKK